MNEIKLRMENLNQNFYLLALTETRKLFDVRLLNLKKLNLIYYFRKMNKRDWVVVYIKKKLPYISEIIDNNIYNCVQLLIKNYSKKIMKSAFIARHNMIKTNQLKI